MRRPSLTALALLIAAPAAAQQVCAGATSVRGTATNFAGSASGAAMPSAPGGPSPEMTAHCDGDLMLMTVGLPEPIGTVTYDLRRIPGSGLPAEMRAAIDEFRGD